MDTLVGLLKNVQYIVENKTFICPVTYEKKTFQEIIQNRFFQWYWEQMAVYFVRF